MTTNPSQIIRTNGTISAKDLILLALIGCGAEPTRDPKRGIHRMYLFTYIKLARYGTGYRPLTEETLQGCVEKEGDLWTGNRGTGIYYLSNNGAAHVKDRWRFSHGTLTAEHDFVGLPFRAAISGELRNIDVRMEYDGAVGGGNLKAVHSDGTCWPSAAEVLRNLGVLDSEWKSSSGARHLYNMLFAEGEKVEVEW